MVIEKASPASDLLKKPTQSRKYLVYTSAGDQANVHHWMSQNRQFDLWITYYGDHTDKHRAAADYYNARKGAKFPNLLHAFQNWPELFQSYDAVLVMDDDIIIDADEIDKLFAIRDKYDLWAIQPCFDPRSKISHRLTRWDPRYYMRFTNFVEMNAPLFKWNVLERFLRVYDSRVTGWGVDWWYMSTMGADINGKVAIVDAVRCINPYEFHKKENKREMDKLPQTLEQRMSTWAAVEKELGIEIKKTEACMFSGVKNSRLKTLYQQIQFSFLKKVSRQQKKRHKS